MSNIKLILIIIGMAVVTYIPRVVPILFFSKREIPKEVKTWMQFIPVSVFSSLIVKDIFFRAEKLNLSILNPKLLAGVIVAFVVYKTKSIWITILVGMTAFYFLLKI